MFSVQIALKFEKMAVVAGEREMCGVGERATYESHTRQARLDLSPQLTVVRQNTGKTERVGVQLAVNRRRCASSASEEKLTAGTTALSLVHLPRRAGSASPRRHALSRELRGAGAHVSTRPCLQLAVFGAHCASVLAAAACDYRKDARERRTGYTKAGVCHS